MFQTRMHQNLALRVTHWLEGDLVAHEAVLTRVREDTNWGEESERCVMGVGNRTLGCGGKQEKRYGGPMDPP